jgi:hypothetical protein
MKTANELTAPIMAGRIPAQREHHAPVDPQSIDTGAGRVVNALFRELQSCFPAWRQAWPTDDAMACAKKTWIKGFAAAGITRIEQIKFGIEQCRLMPSDFMPSVGRFIELCKPTPEMLGIPSLDKAFDEACRKAHPAMAGAAWSHQAVYHAACESGFFNLNTLPMDASRKLFARNYAITVQMLIDGKTLKAIPLALPEGVSTRTPDVGRSALAALRSKLKGAVHG